MTMKRAGESAWDEYWNYWKRMWDGYDEDQRADIYIGQEHAYITGYNVGLEQGATLERTATDEGVTAARTIEQRLAAIEGDLADLDVFRTTTHAGLKKIERLLVSLERRVWNVEAKM